MRKSNTFPVIMYPEGVIVGKVRTGKDARSGKMRHVAFDSDGGRVGTFDKYNDAKDALIGIARRVTQEEG